MSIFQFKEVDIFLADEVMYIFQFKEVDIRIFQFKGLSGLMLRDISRLM